MPFTVKQAVEWVGGEIVGNAEFALDQPRTLADAGPTDLTFVDGDKNAKAWLSSKAGAGIVPANFTTADGRPLIRVADPLTAFLKLVLHLRGDRTPVRKIDASASIHPSATVGANVSIGPKAVIGEGTSLGDNCTIGAGVVVGRFCKLGDHCELNPGVVVYDDSVLGNRVILHANVVIGADGFGYRTVNGKHEKIPQLGSVELGDDVEIGANSTVDRGTFGPTRIGAGTKIDNLVMISHNCQIGRHNIFVSQVGIAGSTSTGDYVILAGQVGVADHLHIGEQSVIGAQCGVIQDIPAKSKMLGSPAMPGSDYMRCVANWHKMPDLRKDVARIKKHLNLEESK